MLKNKQGKLIIVVGIIVFIFILLTNNLLVNNKLQQLKREVNELQYAFNDVSQQLNKIVKMNSIVLDSQYKVKKILNENLTLGHVIVELTSNKLGSYENLKVLYRKTYDSTKPENFNYSSEEWKNIEIVNDTGEYSVEFTVPFSCNYELKIAYEDNNHINYEQLPDLDLYSKAEHLFMKDINIYDVKNNKIEFDVQISKFESNDDTKLLSAICNIYYDNDVVGTFDVIKENEVMGRKEPNNQLEHLDGDYWFIIKEIELVDISNFDESKIVIELILEDSLKNTYKMTRDIN